MNPLNRKAWMEIIVAEELDQHLSAVGQAETNALLVAEMFRDYPLFPGARVLIPGGGTGQMFDYITPQQIGLYHFTFTDINPHFLERVKERLTKFPNLDYEIQEDDLESSRLSHCYDGTLAVLLLEHLDWRKGVESLVSFTPAKMYFVLQQQISGLEVNLKRKLLPSIQKFSETAQPNLIVPEELISFLKSKGYSLDKTYQKAVPDQKEMRGLVFERKER